MTWKDPWLCSLGCCMPPSCREPCAWLLVTLAYPLLQLWGWRHAVHFLRESRQRPGRRELSALPGNQCGQLVVKYELAPASLCQDMHVHIGQISPRITAVRPVPCLWAHKVCATSQQLLQTRNSPFTSRAAVTSGVHKQHWTRTTCDCIKATSNVPTPRDGDAAALPSVASAPSAFAQRHSQRPQGRP